MTVPVETYYAAGSSLATLVNLETVISAPSSVEGGRVPSLAPNFERSLDGVGQRNGKIITRLKITDATDAERVALNTLLFGAQNVASKELYMTLLGDDGYYNPYLVVADRPIEMEQYAPTLNVGDPYFMDGLILPLFNPRLQSLSKTANYTITTSDHLVYFDTSSGNLTAAVAAVAGFTENVVYSVVKSAGSNSLTINPDGAETISGASTLAVTTRVDFIKQNGVWITI